jgi:thimet oligopeptidase
VTQKLLFPALLLALWGLTACDRAETPAPEAVVQSPAAEAGLEADYRKPDLTALQTAEALNAACEAEVAAMQADVSRLEAFSGTPTVEGYLEPLNAMLVSFSNMNFASSVLASVHPDEAVRDAGDACSQALTPVLSDYSLSRPIYERVAAVDLSGADADTQRFVEKQLQDFRLAGVDRDEATRARIKALQEEITRVGQQFDRNINDAIGYLELDSVEQLAGLPQDYIDAHPPGEDGKIRISTQYPDLFPFMSYAESDELRRQMAVIYNNRAYPENEALLQELLALRFEFAQLLGFDNYAQWVTADKMVGSPERVESFLEELSGYTEEPQEREYAMLLARLQEEQPDAERVESWQGSYLQEKISAEDFQVDSKEVRQYFNYQATRDGILRLVQDLFNVQIKPWATATWHADVEGFELWDGEELIGRFFLDMHPREGKYQHAAVAQISDGITGQQVPLATLMCNFPRGGELMEHSQVVTFLHEFGHLIHYLFAGGHHWSGVSGISTEWDFVEAPSQMLQEWVWDYDTIAQFAKNAEGEVIPRALLDRMVAARDFGLGMGTRRQLSLAGMSLGIYNRNPDGLDLKEFTDGMTRKYTKFEPLPEGNFYAAFPHLNGYSAIYYTYQWSLAIASDMFTRFEQEGLRNVETAAEYREKILEPGGARPAAELVTDFLGREISTKPYADRLSRAGLEAGFTE